MSSPAATDLLVQFRQAFADVNLSPAEARQLREQLSTFVARGGDVVALRQQLFGLAQERFNTFKDKAVVEWLEAASALLPPPAAAADSNPSAVYFSPGAECVAAIRRFLHDAWHTLDVCVFTVADDRLTDALRAAHRRGVRVRLITDNDKLNDRGSDVRELHAAGLPVRTDRTEYHMHHKFAVADGRTVLTGSYNWTRSAAEHNLENLLISSDPTLVQPYAREFRRLWEQLPEFEG